VTKCQSLTFLPPTNHKIGSKGNAMEKLEIEQVNSRRDFLKKVGYVAPVVMGLGALNAYAGTTPGSSVFKTNLYAGSTQTDANYIGTTAVAGHNGVVDSGTITDTKGNVTTYTAAQIDANNSPYASFWNDFKQYFGGIS
jgi:hypothetical protein